MHAGMHHTTHHLKDMGKQVCLALIINTGLDAPHNEEPQPLPDGETPQIINFSKESILEELKSNQELLKDNNDNESSGSESDPSEDNLDPEEITTVYPVTLTPKPKGEAKKQIPSSCSPKKRAGSNRSLTSQKERNKIIIKCKQCGEPEMPGHVCQKPKPKLRPIMKPQPVFNQSSPPYYNAAGKKVRDQATQTGHFSQTPIVKTAEEQKINYPVDRAAQASPVKKEQRAPYRANSSDETSVMSRFWKNEKVYPGLVRNSRQSSAWKQSELNKK